jgi:hypothetical protein
MLHESSSVYTRQDVALKRCDTMIEWFDRHKRRSRILYQVFQTGVIVLGALTPVLILSDVSKWLQAGTAALVAVAAGMLSTFQWHESWLRQAESSEALKSEKSRFLTQTGDDYRTSVPREVALERFVENTERLSQQEVRQWRAQQRSGRENEGQERAKDPSPVGG